MTKQSSFPFHPQTYTQRANAISAKASKQRRKTKPQRLALPMYMGDFPAQEGVPTKRADCPKGFCTRIRCRMHLAMEDAEHRAGRPGLASVPRDELGHTMPVDGEAGEDRAGTTFRPDWLPLDRTCRVLLLWDANGNVSDVEPLVPVTSKLKPIYTFKKQRIGTWDMMEARLHPGEKLEAYDSDEQHVANAYYMPDGTLCFDRSPFAVSVTLVRVRGVSSCALDEVQKHGAMTNTQIGDAIGRHRTLAARIVKGALGKAMTNAAEMGMSEADLLAGLRELGAG